MSEWIYGDYAEAAAAHKEKHFTDQLIGNVWAQVNTFCPGGKYRWRKPVVCREVTLKYAPMTERPKRDEKYFVPWAGASKRYVDYTWHDGDTDRRIFERGMCFTEEAVKEYIKQHGWVK